MSGLSPELHTRFLAAFKELNIQPQYNQNSGELLAPVPVLARALDMTEAEMLAFLSQQQVVLDPSIVMGGQH